MAKTKSTHSAEVLIDVRKAQSSIKDLQGSLKDLASKDITNLGSASFNKLINNVDRLQKRLDDGVFDEKDLKEYENLLIDIERGYGKVGQGIDRIKSQPVEKLVKYTKEQKTAMDMLQQRYKSSIPDLKNVKSTLADVGRVGAEAFKDTLAGAKYGEESFAQLGSTTEEVRKKIQELQKMANNEMKYAGGRDQTDRSDRQKQWYAHYQQLQKVIKELEVEYKKLAKAEAELQEGKDVIDAEAMKDAQEEVGKITKRYTELGNTLKGLVTPEQDKSLRAQVALNEQLTKVTDAAKRFFSLGSAVMIFRKIVTSAIETVKELDKAMTETAVVTEFDVGDMWSALPEYTDIANRLGATTLGAYQTMTLYYQQGLKTNEVFAVGTETMKMARIAGMDYAEATNLMTAALRGFNMEINDTNAQRINDVYSELAAKTAASTEEIAQAMTKTASINHSAGMEFETSAAFLTQMIETTREAPENLGTAMKTIVARFTELKKPLSEIGEIDGEIVDANRIEKALRSVGVELRDRAGEFRDLDDVFMELSQKWDSLGKMQQRYVATMAAGSRQQSRFIAMMSNWGRTSELINYANESAGASNKQFEKTLDSLESKLNQLKNAWDQFTMSISNNLIIKFVIDLMTGFLNTINKLTAGMPALISSFANLGFLVGGLFGGKKLLVDTLLSSLLQRSDKGVAKLFARLVAGPAKEALKGVLSENAMAWLLKEGSKEAAKKAGKEIGGEIVENVGDVVAGPKGKGLISKSIAGLKPVFTEAFAVLGSLSAPVLVGAITASVAFLALGKAIYDASPAGALAKAQKEADKARKAYDEAKKELDSFVNASEGYLNAQENLGQFVEGSEEWVDALKDVNAEAKKLLEVMPELYKYLDFKNGQFVIDETQIGNIKKELETDATNTKKESFIFDVEVEVRNVANERVNLDGFRESKAGQSNSNEVKRREVALEELETTLPATITTMFIEAFGSEFESSNIGGLAFATIMADFEKAFEDGDENAIKDVAERWNKETIQELEEAFKAGDTSGDLAKELDSSGVALQEIFDRFSEQIKEAKDRLGKSLPGILKLDNDLIIGLSGQLDKITESWGAEAAGSFTDALGRVKSEVPEDFEKLVEAINKTDLDSIGSIRELPNLLDDMGSEIPEDEMNVFINQLIRLRGVLPQTLDEFEGMLGKTLGMSRKIEGGQDTFSPEEYAELKESSLSTETLELFVRDLETGNYKFLGDTEALGEEYIAGMQAASEGLIAEREEISKRLGILDLNENRYVKEYLTDDATELQQERVVNAVGYDTAVLSKEQITALFQNLLNASKDLNYEATTRDMQGATQSAAYQKRSDTRGALDQAVDEDDWKNAALLTEKLIEQAKAAKVNQSAIDKLEAAKEKYIKTEGKAGEVALKTEAGLLDQAIQTKEVEKIWDDFSSAYEKHLNVLNNGEATYAEQAEAVSGLQASLEAITGIKISEGFIAENQAMIDAFAAGTVTVDELRAKALTDSFNNLVTIGAMTADEVAALTEYINGLEPELSVTGTFDPTAIIAALQLTEAQVRQFAAAMESLGYEAVWEEIYPKAINVDTWSIDKDGQYVRGPRSRALSLPQARMVFKRTGSLPNVSGFVPPSARRSPPSGGGGGSGGSGGGGGGSGSSGADSEKPPELWTNEYDKLYNLLEKIAEKERELGKIQRDYNNAIEDGQLNTEKVLALRQKELKALGEQYNLQKQLIAGRKAELSALGSKQFEHDETKKSFSSWGVTNLAGYDQNLGTVTIDWNSINAITDVGKGAAVQEYISLLESISSGIEDGEDKLGDIEDSIRDIIKRGREDYVTLEKEIYDALVAQQQKIIDNLASMSEIMANSDSQILSALQESIDMERQIRDTVKQQDEIAMKERQLAYMSQDMSGGNLANILRMERELENQRTAMEDNLVDQRLQQLSKENEVAQQQRQLQIEIAQKQLEHLAMTGAFWPRVESMIDNGTNRGFSDIKALLAKQELTDAMSTAGKTIWTEDFMSRWESAMEGLASFTKPTTVASVTKTPAATKTPVATKTPTTKAPAPAPAPAPKPAAPAPRYHTVKEGENLSVIAQRYYGNGNLWPKIFEANRGIVSNSDLIYPNQKLLIPFRSGGYTGDWSGDDGRLALLHKKELVLNATDSYNLLQLKDALSNLYGSTGGQNSGLAGNNFYYNINVENVGSQADVDRLEQMLRRRMAEDSQYRNVNVLTTKR